MAAPSPQGHDHPISTNVQTEDVAPQHPVQPLLPETLGETLAHRKNVSSSKRKKNGEIVSWQQDCPPLKVFTIEIWNNDTKLVSP